MALNNAGASFDPEDMQMLEILADQTSTFLQVAELYESNGELMLDAIKALVAAIDAKDPYTQGHSQRVSDYSVMIAQELGLPEAQVYEVRVGSLFHDVGKIGIPDAILQKQGKLTAEEYADVKKHSQTGKNILGQVKMLEPMLPAILEHHERLDGSGYPFGLKDQQISRMGRIVAVADVFDAMTSTRPYRKALAVSDVLEYLEGQAGILFDEACVGALIRIIQRADRAG
jgi:HD-GYP domain-containing protein (c-di-GMP phosphodiesterase class II)